MNKYRVVQNVGGSSPCPSAILSAIAYLCATSQKFESSGECSELDVKTQIHRTIIFDCALKVPDFATAAAANSSDWAIFLMVDDQEASDTLTGLEAGYPMAGDFVAVAHNVDITKDIENTVTLFPSNSGSHKVSIGVSTNSKTDFYAPFSTSDATAVVPAANFNGARKTQREATWVRAQRGSFSQVVGSTTNAPRIETVQGRRAN